jgi:hypothetical protein
VNWVVSSDPIVSLGIGLILTIGAYLLQPRVRIVWTVSHGFIHLLRGSEFAKRQTAEQAKSNPSPNNMSMWAQTLLVMNRGRAVAEKLEIVLNHKPLGLTVWPQRQYIEGQNPDNKFVLQFDDLSSQEAIHLHMIDTQELPMVFNVRCKTKIGKYVNSQPQILYPTWLISSVWALLIFGMVSALSLLAYGVIISLRMWGSWAP